MRERVREKIRPETLAQQVDDFSSSADVPAAGAAERLAERATDEIDPIHHATVFVRAPASPAHEANCMAVVDHHKRSISFREVTNLAQRGDEAIHREHTVG